MIKEKWKDIEGYEGYYQISNKVNVFSLISNKVLKPGLTSKKYLSVSLFKNKTGKTHTIHSLNANQANRKKEKHICPLQLDIIERLIFRFTNENDVVDDPFGGLFSTAYIAYKKKRKSISAELNPAYYDDGLFYLKALEYKMSVPTLFDFIDEK